MEELNCVIFSSVLSRQKKMLSGDAPYKDMHNIFNKELLLHEQESNCEFWAF